VWFRDGGYSFPSGHITLFASICIPLAVMYPRARPLLVIVLFAMCARVAVNAHFLSDVLGGLALTLAVTWLCAVMLRRALPSLTPPACRR
jgi:membrane-associated phospholipid phosphatase